MKNYKNKNQFKTKKNWKNNKKYQLSTAANDTRFEVRKLGRSVMKTRKKALMEMPGSL